MVTLEILGLMETGKHATIVYFGNTGANGNWKMNHCSVPNGRFRNNCADRNWKTCHVRMP